MSVVREFKLPRKGLSKKRLINGPKSKWKADQLKRALDDWEHEPYQAAYGQLPIGLAVARPTHNNEPLDPHMPGDITQLNNDGIGLLYGQMIAMATWLDWKVAEAQILSTNQEAYLEHVKAEIRLKKAGTVKDKDAKTLNDPAYIKEELKFIELNARFKLLQSRLRGYEKCAAALSREMTRRQPIERHV